jgi:hypothetical protein
VGTAVCLQGSGMRYDTTGPDLPVPVPAYARVLPVFASLIPQMIVPYADAAALMLANLDRGNAMSRHRVEPGCPWACGDGSYSGRPNESRSNGTLKSARIRRTDCTPAMPASLSWLHGVIQKGQLEDSFGFAWRGARDVRLPGCVCCASCFQRRSTFAARGVFPSTAYFGADPQRNFQFAVRYSSNGGHP